MSYTPVQNRFWSDGWVRQLNALDRYLFLYLLTNGRARLTGIYELPLDLMAAESGIDEKDLRISMLQRLEPKVYYKEGWIIMTNFIKHRVSNSPALVQGILKEFEELPTHIKEIAIQKGYPLHTLPRGSRNRIEEKRIDNTPEATASETLREVKINTDGVEYKPLVVNDGNKKYEGMVLWAEKRRESMFVNRVKQYGALKKAKAIKITSVQLKERWEEMESMPYWQEKGFDWVNVVNSFDKRP